MESDSEINPLRKPISDHLEIAVQKARQAVLQQRHADGYWEGHLASSPLATAVALCALADEEAAVVAWQPARAYLSRTQNADGGWGDTGISKSNLAATVLALCADAAARTPGVGAAQSDRGDGLLPMGQRERGWAYVELQGGLGAGLRKIYGKDLTFQVPIRVAAAFAGLLDWREVEALPLELALIPRGFMGAIGLPVVSYALPALVCMGLARHGQAPTGWVPLRWLRDAAAERVLDLCLRMQPESGGFLEAIPITAFCLLGLKAAGRGDHPLAQNARRFLQSTQRAEGSWPVEVHLATWNTTRVVDAAAAGGDLGELSSSAPWDQTRTWIQRRQTMEIHSYTATRPGGWGWNQLSGSVPDADDTAGAILALRSLGVGASDRDLAAGARWLLDLQNRDGGWPTFCRGWQKLPFDRSAADLTAHALRALHSLDATPAYRRAIQKGWRYLKSVQGKDGSFKPLWFGCETASDELNATYGTCHVLLACDGRSYPLAGDIASRALSWLRAIQNEDGGFGGCGGAPSTAEETGMALRALCAHGLEDAAEACDRAATWLIDHQRADGSWQPAPIGFYFAVLWYYETMYPLVYGWGGLGAYVRKLKAAHASPRAVAAGKLVAETTR